MYALVLSVTKRYDFVLKICHKLHSSEAVKVLSFSTYHELVCY